MLRAKEQGELCFILKMNPVVSVTRCGIFKTAVRKTINCINCV